MKQTLKKAMMPLAVVVLGAAAAFATNAAKQSEKTETAAMQGYYYDHNETAGNRCKPITVDCTYRSRTCMYRFCPWSDMGT